jgi:hypothetical protein
MKYVTTFYEFDYGNKHKKLGEVEGILLIPLYVGMQITLEAYEDDFKIEKSGYFQSGEYAELRIILKKLRGKSAINFRDQEQIH